LLRFDAIDDVVAAPGNEVSVFEYGNPTAYSSENARELSELNDRSLEKAFD